jgi:hypothetical protein
LSEQLDHGIERFDLFGIADDVPSVKLPDDAHPQAPDTLAEHRAVVWHRFVAARGITRIVPGDDLEHQRVVAHRACHRPDMVERVGQRHDAAAAHPAIGRLHAGDAAHRGGVADLASCVGAERCREKAGGETLTAAAR